MKKKIILLIVILVFVAAFIGSCVFFGMRGVDAMEKEIAYFEVYQKEAEAYIRSDPEIIRQYGEPLSVSFKSSVSYQRIEEKDYFDRVKDIFSPDVPDTLEAFGETLAWMRFDVNINGTDYQITLEKNELGEFAVTEFTRAK